MNKELFGVFGDVSDFRRYRSLTGFDRVVEGDSATVGIRDVALGIPGRSAVHEGDQGVCVLWGEVFHPATATVGAAEWLLDRYGDVGTDALGDLNGSYVAVVDDGSGAVVATDPARTWECYYTDDRDVRLFGTAPDAVATHIASPEPSRQGLLEFLHLGVVLGNRTTIEGLHRTPFDGCLYADATRDLRRFVYEPTEFDYVGELATRLRRAFARRSKIPGRKGLLLSGGYDSRTVLAGIPNIDQCYTVGTTRSSEVKVARRVAEQYDVPHRVLTVDERYLSPNEDVIGYGHGIKESLHIHHGAYDDGMDVDAMFHGLLWDTFFRGHFLPEDRVDLFGYEVPRNGLDPESTVAETLVDEKFGFIPTEKDLVAGSEAADDARAMAFEAVETQLEGQTDRYDSVYNATDLVGIQNNPPMPFRNHLADRYIESFVAADSELIDWHLRTPPEHRNSRTFLEAIRRIDGDVLRHRPPDRHYDSLYLNMIRNFARRKCPFVSGFTGSWPDRVRHYNRHDYDARLFPGRPAIHDLPPRLKLRINDVTTWLDATADGGEDIAAQALRTSV